MIPRWWCWKLWWWNYRYWKLWWWQCCLCRPIAYVVAVGTVDVRSLLDLVVNSVTVDVTVDMLSRVVVSDAVEVSEVVCLTSSVDQPVYAKWRQIYSNTTHV